MKTSSVASSSLSIFPVGTYIQSYWKAVGEGEWPRARGKSAGVSCFGLQELSISHWGSILFSKEDQMKRPREGALYFDEDHLFLTWLAIINRQGDKRGRNPLGFLMSLGGVSIPSLARELNNKISTWSQKCLLEHSGILQHDFCSWVTVYKPDSKRNKVVFRVIPVLIQGTDVFLSGALYPPPELEVEDSVSASPWYAFRTLTENIQ